MAMNEPVAWMELYKGKPNNLAFNKFDVLPEPPDWTVVPLYPHPVKELMDEETWDVIDNCFGIDAFNFDYQITLGEARANAFELVKAILRKTQEK